MPRLSQRASILQWSAFVASLVLLVTCLVCTHVLRATGIADDAQIPQNYSPTGYPNMPPGAQAELQRISNEINQTEQIALESLNSSMDPMHQIQTLGKLEIYDESLSLNKNEACSTCHMPEAGFTGASQVLNMTTVSYPGSVQTRYSARKPLSYLYSTYAPVLHYNATQNDFYGGNFWDMRATGWQLQSPSAQQAQGPPTNPVEMGLPDSACLAWRISQGKYLTLFTQVWGPGITEISWPANAEKTCSTPAGAGGVGPQLSLNAEDRDRANTVYNEFALAVASYEASPEVDTFSSKFDNWLAGTPGVSLTSSEMHGYQLFNGQGKCNTCHLSGNASGATGGTPADVAPLFTDFTSSNLGLPKNIDIPYYYENKPDAFGFVANPQGMAYVDLGVGAFLSGAAGVPVPDQSWMALAPGFNGKMQVATLRDVDKRPYPGFIRDYMHNGYLKSLKEVVHFYNTRDNTCPSPNDPGVKVTCWPAPEVSANEDQTVGNLGLTPQDEDDIVAFLKTLTDGYSTTSPWTNPPQGSSRQRRQQVQQ